MLNDRAQANTRPPLRIKTAERAHRAKRPGRHRPLDNPGRCGRASCFARGGTRKVVADRWKGDGVAAVLGTQIGSILVDVHLLWVLLLMLLMLLLVLVLMLMLMLMRHHHSAETVRLFGLADIGRRIKLAVRAKLGRLVRAAAADADASVRTGRDQMLKDSGGRGRTTGLAE